MKKIFLTISSLASLSFFFTSCNQTEFDQDVADIKVTSGNANFAKYISLGNSLTSGYRDGALYSDGQLESYPSMIAKQMQLTTGGAFKQPMITNNIGGFSNFSNLGLSGKLQLQLVSGALAPVPSAPGGVFDMIGSAGPYQNLGVPGAKSFHLVAPGYGNPAEILTGKANPYFVRFASSATTSVIADAVAQVPTFYSLWIGNNDVLSYATSGGTNVTGSGATAVYTPAVVQTSNDPTTYRQNDITSPILLASVISTMVTQLKATGAKGILANIPNVTSIPFFTTVPAKPIIVTSAEAAQLNAAYAPYNNGLLGAKNANLITQAEYDKRYIKFTEGAGNGAVIEDKDVTNLAALGIPSYRQTTAKDAILLTTVTKIRTAGGGTAVALKNQDVLTENELTLISTATNAYNTSIKQIADANGLAFFDANAKMVELSQVAGLVFDGVRYTTTFVSGGSFSLDGVHLTGRGCALIANEFLNAINIKYGSNLPMVNINKYSGVTFPN